MGENPTIRVLGELEVSRAGRVAALPASKKTRALLGYLAVTRRAHSREQLCDLLWQGPNDPRAALRWSLAKLRAVLGPEALIAGRERIALGKVATDLDAVHVALADGIDAASPEVLIDAAQHFRGELLEGLALPDCYRYHEWYVAERESARARRLRVAKALCERHAADSEQALRWARECVALDPLSESAHVRVITLLVELGRRREATEQFETCRRILAEELGAKPSPALLHARLLATASPSPTTRPVASPPPAPRDASEATSATALPLIGRARELGEALSMLEQEDGDPRRVLVVLGEPGIGKSRLLAELAEQTQRLGGTVLSGRAFEAEMVRPYGPWMDALGALPSSAVPNELRAALGPLLSEQAISSGSLDRASFFDAVARLLTHLATSAAPLTLLLDDVHWLDEASAGLLHYVARRAAGSRVLIACGARPGELSDNPAALRLTRGLSREQRSKTLALLPLDRDATAQLARLLSTKVDSERVVRESEGNPLLALELTRALDRNPNTVWDSLSDLIGERLLRLSSAALELVSLAAALGKNFDLLTLERVTRAAPLELIGLVSELERHGVVRPTADGSGFDFVHDLVRTGAYRRLSEPRRRAVHRQIARTLDEASSTNPALAAEVAHHAHRAADGALVARAACSAAQRCLRLFAGAEAARLAKLGLKYSAEIAPDQRLATELALLEVLVYSGASVQSPERLKHDLARTIDDAQKSGHPEAAAKGLHALSTLQFDTGDLAGAHASTLRVATAVEAADPLVRARALGDSARCLGTLERDLDQAQAMVTEARRLAAAAGVDLLELEWSAGLLSAFRGEIQAASRSLERALLLARSAEDRWAEYECLRQWVQLELESGTSTERCVDLLAVATKMAEGSELPSAHALDALNRLVRGDPGAEPALERALLSLRHVDAKGMLAYVLVFAAERDFEAGRYEAAEHRASEALGAATAVHRHSQVALAHVVLGRVALARGDRRSAKRQIVGLNSALQRPLGLSARARTALLGLSAAIEGFHPTTR